MHSVDFDDYEHEGGECLRGAYAHFTGPRWCGHPLCLFDSCGGDLAAVEAALAGHGYDAHQVARMLESHYVPLAEQRAEESLLRGGHVTPSAPAETHSEE
ncbi:MAG TPA: hypothetical protein VF508_02030 [Pyrinomonadaceae bacterium]|jgi:hypothetical protein